MSKGMKAFRKQARTAERVAVRAGDAFVSDQMRTLAQAFRAQAEVMKKKRKKKMSFTVKANCQHGQLIHRRKTAEAALKKARELSKNGCYDVHIVTPEGRDYASPEFGDIPRTPLALRAVRKTQPIP
jgi:hypothetical protein